MKLTLPFPPSVNGLFRNVPMRGRVKTKRYESWLKLAMGELMVQRARPVYGPVRIAFWYSPPDRRPRGLDNYLKAPLDLLVKAGIIENDEQAVRGLRPEWDESRDPGCYMEILSA